MDFARPEYLVTTDWLAAHLDSPHVRVLDVTAKLNGRLENRAEAECYREGHIPGSLFFDSASGKGVLSNQSAELPWMWPTVDEVGAALNTVGVGPDTKVVLVARTPREGIDSGTMWCTRAWWTLHHSGVDCAILWGGIEQWEAEGRPLTDEPSTVPSIARPAVLTPATSGNATRAEVLAAVHGTPAQEATAPTCLVDALPADSFDGTGTSYGPRSGHITGAINVPFRSLIETETAAFVEPVAMHEHLSRAGLLDERDVITYCGGAIAATVDAFALALFGKTNVAVYDGSLMEWTADPDLPMNNPSGAA
jgi:thiosulfate/3-mercaptopyruvate sulfurtransferase